MIDRTTRRNEVPSPPALTRGTPPERLAISPSQASAIPSRFNGNNQKQGSNSSKAESIYKSSSSSQLVAEMDYQPVVLVSMAEQQP